MKIVRILLFVALVAVAFGLRGYKGYKTIQRRDNINYSYNYNKNEYEKKQREIAQLISDIENKEENIENERQKLVSLLDDPYCDKSELNSTKDGLVYHLNSYKRMLNELKSKKRGVEDVVKECDEQLAKAEKMLRDIENM